MNNSFDIIIIGAGPAGLTTAIKLGKTGLKIALIDKNTIPCSKVCGDALSGSVMNVLKRLPGNCYEDFLRLPGLTPSWGIRFFSPADQYIDVPFVKNPDRSQPAPGFLCRRIVFDGFLAGKLSAYPAISIFPEKKVTGVELKDDGISVLCDGEAFHGKIAVGADGVHSLTGRLQAGNQSNARKYCLGIRGYYRNVRDFHPESFIELHFIRELLPGYLWIFPMEDGIANVGLGIIYDHVKKEEGSLIELLTRLVRTHPSLSGRFKDAEPIGKPEAHGLPMGPDDKPVSGNRFLLAGDAASLVDPFTGEGIANAMISGEIAADVIAEAFDAGDFSASFLVKYDRKIRQRIWPELKVSSLIRKSASSAYLFNRVVKKASENEKVREMLTRMYTDEKARAELASPLFYMKLLMK